MLLVGIWQGKGKPPFKQYLEGFAKEMNELKTNGVDIRVSGETHVVKLSVVCATLDLPAKASVLNMTQYNGGNACITCEEGGEVVPQGRGHARCYPYRPGPAHAQNRNHEGVVQCMMQGTPATRCKGFCGQSGLASLDGFDLVQGVVPDYMHGLLLGITKTLMSKWFSATESSKPYFVGKHLQRINNNLMNMKPPDFIERLPRDLEKNYSHFKATELQTWLLFYCIPCLSGILPDRYLKHVAKLSEAAHIFLGDSISTFALSRASDLLDEFYKDFAAFYGQGSCGLNVHNAGAHMASYVKLWGPMWAWSCFAFEDANAMILQSVHGTGDVVRQVLKFKVAQGVTRKCVFDKKIKRVWSNLKPMTNCDVAGKIKKFSEEKRVEKNVADQLNEGQLRKVDRVVCGQKMFYSVEYGRMKRRECSVIRTCDNEYGRILLFVVNKQNECSAVVRMFIETANSGNVLSNTRHLISVQLSDIVNIIPVQYLEEIMVFLHCGNAQYISSSPNKHGRSVFK